MKKIMALIVLTVMCLLFLCSCSEKERDIRSVEINDNGELILNFTDGTQSSLGRIMGTDGKDGKDGADGEKGDTGEKGADGEKGKDGTNGKDGLNGKDGVNGKDGKGISSITQNDDGQIVVLYTDGTSENISLTLGVLGGKCGDNVNWALFTGGILVIDGQGATYDYNQGTTPWYSFIDGIAMVYVNNIDVTIGEGLLYGFDMNIVSSPEQIAASVWVDMTEQAPIYATADISSDIKGYEEFATELKCLEWGEVFSRVICNGEVAFIETKYINKDNGSLVFDDADFKVRVVSDVNLRTFTDASETSNNIHRKALKDEVLNVTGVSKNTRWLRIDDNGKVLYVRNSTVYVVQTA